MRKLENLDTQLSYMVDFMLSLLLGALVNEPPRVNASLSTLMDQ